MVLDATGESTLHLPLAALEAGWHDLSAAPRDAGRIALIVRRPAAGKREELASTRLTREEGIPGDDWARRPPGDPEAQLAVMRRDVAALIANGQPIVTFGDNLYVDLDLSVANLPIGSRLRVGEALVVVTAKPHNGCSKFRGRFGDDALRFVQAKATRDQNFRGIYWKVLEPGAVRVGGAIAVLSRGAEAL